MKKFLLLAVIFFVLAFQSVNAQELSAPPTQAQKQVLYDLPYPGILPGEPLYFLKVIRDSVADFMISNSLKKAEYDLLQADKQLQATVLLVQHKKDEKTITATLIAAEDNFAKAVVKKDEAAKQGINTKEFVAKLVLANKKHQEVISEIVKSTKGDINKEAVRQLEKAKELGETVSTEELN